MSEHAAAPGGHGHGVVSPISVPWVIAAALLCAAGLFVIWWWLYTFNLEFVWGIALVFLGAMMFLNPRAGWDHA